MMISLTTATMWGALGLVSVLLGMLIKVWVLAWHETARNEKVSQRRHKRLRALRGLDRASMVGHSFYAPPTPLLVRLTRWAKSVVISKGEAGGPEGPTAEPK